jgi:hypothetical protein
MSTSSLLVLSLGNLAAALCGLVLGTGFAWRCRADLLPQAVDLWSVSDSVGPADAVAVLGGELETRPLAAADYYRQGLVPKVLVSNGRSTAAKAELLPYDAEVTRNLLVRLGVPETAIELVGTDLSNTFEEALALRRWPCTTARTGSSFRPSTSRRGGFVGSCGMNWLGPALRSWYRRWTTRKAPGPVGGSTKRVWLAFKMS